LGFGRERAASRARQNCVGSGSPAIATRTSVGQADAYLVRARALDAVETNRSVQLPNPITTPPPADSEAVMIEGAALQENLGEFPGRFTDQGDTMPAPQLREIAREFRDGEK